MAKKTKKTEEPNSDANGSNGDEYAGREIPLGTPEAKSMIDQRLAFHDLSNKSGPNVFVLWGNPVAFPEHWVTMLKEDGSRGRRSVICGGVEAKEIKDEYPELCPFCKVIDENAEHEDLIVEPPQINYRIRAGIPGYAFNTTDNEIKEIVKDASRVNETWGALRLSSAQVRALNDAIADWSKKNGNRGLSLEGLAVCFWREMKNKQSRVSRVDLFPKVKFSGLRLPDKFEIKPRFSRSRLDDVFTRWEADQAVIREEEGL